MKTRISCYFFAIFLFQISLIKSVKDFSKNEWKFETNFRRKCSTLRSYTENGDENDYESVSIPVGFTFFENFHNNNTKNSHTINLLINEIEQNCKLKLCSTYLENCSETQINQSFLRGKNISLACDCELADDLEFEIKRFDRDYARVVFSPYIKNWTNSTSLSKKYQVSKWNNYTFEEIKELISVLATNFSHISTYGIGATSASVSWDDGDSTGLVPLATAEVNKMLKQNNKSTVTVYQGIYHNKFRDIFEQEINNAYEASIVANKIHNGTVIGLIFTSDYVVDIETSSEICSIIDRNKKRARSLGLKIGIRLNICREIVPRKLSEADNDLHSVPHNYTYSEFKTPLMEQIFRNISSHVDFIICSLTPPPFLIQHDMETIVNELVTFFLKIRQIIQHVKSNVTVILQTEWASWGVSRNGAVNDLSSSIEFWVRLSQLGAEHGVHLDFFEAFDEPWKSDKNEDSKGPNGPNGAEAHHGWWRRYDGHEFYTYIPKIQELKKREVLRNKDENEESEDSSSILTIIIAVIVVVLLFFGIIAGFIWRLKREKENIVSRKTRELAKEFRDGYKKMDNKEKDDSENCTPSNENHDTSSQEQFIFALKFPYDKKYEIPRKKFRIDENFVLGEGNYGIVYRGTVDGRTEPAAFKTLNSNGSIMELRNLLSEIKIMSFVGKHENIVSLLGAYTAKIEQGEVYVISEYCELGSLKNYLKSQSKNFKESTNECPVPNQLPAPNYVMAFFQEDEESRVNQVIIPQKILTNQDLYKWSCDIAAGMEYISSKKVIHSDLATRNVLLTSEGRAKITDFGLSRQLYYKTEYLKTTREELPWRWMSLESLRTLIFSIESDIWSFGVTLWEIFSLGQIPYPGIISPNQLFHEFENDYEIPPPSQHTPDDIIEVIKECCDKIPSNRPSFARLKEIFQSKISD